MQHAQLCNAYKVVRASCGQCVIPAVGQCVIPQVVLLQAAAVFAGIEYVVVGIFTGEYTIRLLCAPNIVR